MAGAAAPPAQGAPALLDRAMPRWDFAERHERMVDARPEPVIEAARGVTGTELPVTRVLMTLRTLPRRLSGQRDDLTGGRPLLDALQDGGFVLLGDDGREVVLGTVGQFWRLRGGPVSGPRDIESFAAFERPGFAKAAMNFRVVEAGRRTRLTTETRVQTPDPAARRRFRAYWLFVRLGSGVIRREMLSAVARRAGRPAR